MSNLVEKISGILKKKYPINYPDNKIKQEKQA